MENKTTTLTLTATELDALYYALNAYSLHLMDISKTWGNSEAFRTNGLKHDYYGQEAERIGALQIRVQDARDEITREFVEEIIAGRA